MVATILCLIFVECPLFWSIVIDVPISNGSRRFGVQHFPCDISRSLFLIFPQTSEWVSMNAFLSSDVLSCSKSHAPRKRRANSDLLSLATGLYRGCSPSKRRGNIHFVALVRRRIQPGSVPPPSIVSLFFSTKKLIVFSASVLCTYDSP